jgi:hypothetical protein
MAIIRIVGVAEYHPTPIALEHVFNMLEVAIGVTGVVYLSIYVV